MGKLGGGVNGRDSFRRQREDFNKRSYGNGSTSQPRATEIVEEPKMPGANGAQQIIKPEGPKPS